MRIVLAILLGFSPFVLLYLVGWWLDWHERRSSFYEKLCRIQAEVRKAHHQVDRLEAKALRAIEEEASRHRLASND